MVARSKSGKTNGFQNTSPLRQSHQKPSKLLNNFVCNLINENTKTWKRDLIDNLFLLEEASIIKSIPLNLQDPHDRIIWDVVKFGEYTVKSGYSLLKQRVRVEVGEPSNPNSSKAFWRAI